MMFPNPKNDVEKKMNELEYKFLKALGIVTIVFGIVMYPIVML